MRLFESVMCIPLSGKVSDITGHTYVWNAIPSIVLLKGMEWVCTGRTYHFVLELLDLSKLPAITISFKVKKCAHFELCLNECCI